MSQNDTSQIALATYDPRFSGGVRSVTEFAYETLQDTGVDPYLAFNAYPWEECVTIPDLVRGDRRPTVAWGTYAGMDGARIGRKLPELLVANYRLNRDAWRVALADAEAAIITGGPCLAGVPLTHSDIPYILWIGTTIEDEREVQKHQFGLGRRTRYELARPVLNRQEQRVLQNADRILAQSSYTKQRIVEKHGLVAADIEIVPCPVDTETFSLGPPETNPNEVVFVGRLNDPRKNTELLLNAFAGVVERIPDAQLTLVGAEPNQRHAEMIDSLGIRENVSTPGRVDSVVPYLRRAAVFAFPSRQEGFGIAALEAMACGTPVVSTRCGGPEDFVLSEETGYLVDEGDVQGFSNALRDALNAPTEQTYLGERARETVVETYTSYEISDTLNSIIRGIGN